MDEQTVELLRALQGQERDAAALARISKLFADERVAQKQVDDLGMLSHYSELMEAWAESAPAEFAVPMLSLAARCAEEDLEQLDRAIALLDRALDLEPTADTLQQLGALYERRGGAEDVPQAADLYAALGDTLGAAEGRPWLERAVALQPTHESAIELSRAYAADGKFRDALMCISPIAERGHADAMRLQEAYLANLDGAVPAKQSKRGQSLPPPQHVRPARSGGTMVGFRLDQYHEALRRDQPEAPGVIASAATQGGAPSAIAEGAVATQPAAAAHVALAQPELAAEDSAVRPMPQAPAASAEAEIGSTKLDTSKTILGMGLPIAARASAAEATADPTPSPTSGVAAIATETAAPTGADDPAAEPQGPPVRRSLPAPNPAVVRASKPAPGAQRAAGLQARLAAVNSAAATRASLAAQAVAAPPPAGQAPVATAPQAFAVAASTPSASAATAVATPAALDKPRPKRTLPKPYLAAAAGLVAVVASAFAFLGGSDDAPPATEPVARVSAEDAPQPAAAAPQPAAAAPQLAAAAAAPPSAAIAVAETEPQAEPEAPAPAPVKAKARKPKASIKVSAKTIKVRGGALSGTQVMVALEDALPKLESCYADALADTPRLRGQLTLGFSIQKTGKLASARVEKTTVKNKALEKCAVQALQGQRFPKVKKVANVTLPVTLG